MSMGVCVVRVINANLCQPKVPQAANDAAVRISSSSLKSDSDVPLSLNKPSSRPIRTLASR